MSGTKEKSNASALRGAVITIVIVASLAYVWIALTIFQFRHPELTDTQRLFHIVDAILLRDPK